MPRNSLFSHFWPNTSVGDILEASERMARHRFVSDATSLCFAASWFACTADSTTCLSALLPNRRNRNGTTRSGTSRCRSRPFRRTTRDCTCSIAARWGRKSTRPTSCCRPPFPARPVRDCCRPRPTTAAPSFAARAAPRPASAVPGPRRRPCSFAFWAATTGGPRSGRRSSPRSNR